MVSKPSEVKFVAQLPNWLRKSLRIMNKVQQ